MCRGGVDARRGVHGLHRRQHGFLQQRRHHYPDQRGARHRHTGGRRNSGESTRPHRGPGREGNTDDRRADQSRGKEVAGITTPDKTSWKPSEPLGYGKTYKLVVDVVDANGVATTKNTTLTTVAPSNQTRAYINTTGGASISDGGTYGVGTVVAVHFDELIGDKAAAEKSLLVTTNPPVQGSWYWVDGQNVHWRPQNYYAPGTTVSVNANIYGKQLGNGLYGQQDDTVSSKSATPTSRSPTTTPRW